MGGGEQGRIQGGGGGGLGVATPLLSKFLHAVLGGFFWGLQPLFSLKTLFSHARGQPPPPPPPPPALGIGRKRTSTPPPPPPPRSSYYSLTTPPLSEILYPPLGRGEETLYIGTYTGVVVHNVPLKFVPPDVLH